MRVGQEACLRCRLFQDFHLATDARLLGHLFGKVGIALFQVVSHFVRLHLFLVEITHRGLCQVGKARMFLHRSMLVDVAGQKPLRLRLPACQPSPGFECDCWLSTGAWAVVERSHWPFGHGALHAALDGLMMQSERLTYRKKEGSSGRDLTVIIAAGFWPWWQEPAVFRCAWGQTRTRSGE